MLSIFPIQFLAPIAGCLLRLAIGFIFLRFAKKRFVERKQKNTTLPTGNFFWMGITLEVIASILLILGLFTQIGALIVMLHTSLYVVTYKRTPFPFASHMSLFLIFCIAVSLFITGPGAFAFDLPL